ncbi:SAM-dependent methyltransferase [Rariglobus hedericola]|uniref:Class I SAM-dependent methyltransferase n=1 Tax=Rariglobus hedericola TaxID=2597822 RepID=A0A556QGI2_9BACT|nr:cyclopropane-fatty-acyl-phospholipid synthase family protein [Rariglobus hedericola]TSJ75745.1 class I SAM-dependent methyltransferase [Rariglobus hedericola]
MSEENSPALDSTATYLETANTCGPLCRRMVLASLRDMKLGHLRVELPEGGFVEFGSHADALTRRMPVGLSATACIRVRRPAFFSKCVLSGDIGFAESYLDGDWSTPDLASVLSWFLLNIEHAPTLSGSTATTLSALPLNWLRLVNRLRHLLRPNSRATARRNIAEHYDLSNDFFSLFLDPSMMYSSARWPANAQQFSLQEAQREKNDALCRSLRLKSTDRVLEIGTGWGGWCLHAASNYGCKVTTLTISKEQYELARSRVQAAGLGDRIDVRLEDYRDHAGTYDKIVSIEMMEAIGHDYLPSYCDVLAARLKADGLLALQFITCPDDRYEALRKGVDFIQKHIFPGSLLLSLNRVNQQLTRAGGFQLHHIEDFGPDYARTLRLWRDTFEHQRDRVIELGFDERFIRKWRYYLCYCEAAFAMRNISVVQTLHTRANNLAL